ncbi:hypothetical protein HK101_002489 [Irineochytrium annulatum]|nr:hypothetical protein HK101_002489 [Irineochytrium annulatum]
MVSIVRDPSQIGGMRQRANLSPDANHDLEDDADLEDIPDHSDAPTRRLRTRQGTIFDRFDNLHPNDDETDHGFHRHHRTNHSFGWHNSHDNTLTDEERMAYQFHLSQLLNYHYRFQKWHLTVILVLTGLAMVALVGTFGYLNYRDGTASLNTVDASRPYGGGEMSMFPPADPALPLASISAWLADYQCAKLGLNGSSLVIVNLDVSTIDPATQQAAVGYHLSFTPCGDYAIVGQRSTEPNLRYPLTLVFGEIALIQFASEAPMPDSYISTSFATGDLNNYPFDHYTGNVLQVVATAAVNSSVSVKVPLMLRFTGAAQTYAISVLLNQDVSEGGRGQALWFQMAVDRSVSTKLFSLMVMVVMWAVSLIAFGLSVVSWFAWKKVEPPIIPFSLALL